MKSTTNIKVFRTRTDALFNGLMIFSIAICVIPMWPLLRSSILFGKFSISSIHKIAVNQTLWVGTRPATVKNGVIIYYNKYDEIYFSPSDNEAFVAALLEINPEIEVVRK